MNGAMDVRETDWDQRYVRSDVPWDTNQPSSQLQRVLVEYAVAPCRALELGCGTGTNAVYLASRGFDVTAVDLAPTAIEAAQRRAAGAGVACRFLTADVFKLPDLGPPFEFIFDRGCYHVVRQIDEPGIISVFERQLSPTGRLLVLAGNADEENPPEGGPPRVSEAELRAAFARFEILHLRAFRFDKVRDGDFRPLAWSVLLRRK